MGLIEDADPYPHRMADGEALALVGEATIMVRNELVIEARQDILGAGMYGCTTQPAVPHTRRDRIDSLAVPHTRRDRIDALAEALTHLVHAWYHLNSHRNTYRATYDRPAVH